MTLKKIYFDLKKNIKIDNIPDAVYLEEKYSNVYNILKSKSNNFKDIKILIGLIDQSIGNLRSIKAWAKIIPYYPDTKIGERKILNNNKKMIGTLCQRVPGLHYVDLRIICIANEYGKKVKSQINFITKDGGLLTNKNTLENKFPFILINRVSKYSMIK
ncbi:MAG: hypothetical protein PF542_04195 [Nanoarchaeota archaeon]|jgi:hypothetical protein|nr:hypothetical protein [Nanoarchaeota archaeon]